MNDKMKELEARKAQFVKYVQEQNQKFEEDARKIREDERHKKQSETENFFEDLKKEIAHDYNMSWEQAEILVEQAWQRGHSSGFQEVRTVAADYAEWVKKILDIQRNLDW